MIMRTNDYFFEPNLLIEQYLDHSIPPVKSVVPSVKSVSPSRLPSLLTPRPLQVAEIRKPNISMYVYRE